MPLPVSDPGQPEDGILETVREGYARVARAASGGGCCGSAKAEDVARAVGYSEAELAGLPDGANLGLSCGNPTALAALRPGEVVLDLGSGAGFDGFIAGPRVGAAGRVIGVDMTPEMLARARANLSTYRRRTGLSNVEFRLGEIENLPVADQCVDVLLSNCVLNLSPNKPRVWSEIARVLRPGGRVAVSDLALLRPLPAEVRSMVDALVGCVAGAVMIEETERMMRAAGLTEVRIDPRPGYAERMAEWDDPLYRNIAAHLPPGTGPADFVTSVEISARKPT